jgi:predicted PurR-regulated permease PerM
MKREITRTTLAVLSIGGLIAASFWIVRPFLGALIWATMIVVATWPVLVALQRRLGGKRVPAIALMTLAMLLVFVVPVWVAVSTLADYSDEAAALAKSLQHAAIPLPPPYIEELPVIGGKIGETWRDIASGGWLGLFAKVQPYVGRVAQWMAAEAGSVGMVIVQFLVTIVIAAVLYANAEGAASSVLRFGRRLAGDRGEQSVRLAGQAIRGVALGVVVTALVQSILGGLGLALAGVPFAAVLSLAMLMLCLAQIGPLVVLVPAVIWTFWTGHNGWGIALLVWTVFVGTLDNFLRPYLIKKGADLPMTLIFAGVIGGLLSFGLLGIFVGPVVLAVTYKLLESWMSEADAPVLAATADHKATGKTT